MKRRNFIRTVIQASALTGIAGGRSFLSALPLPEHEHGWIATPVNKHRRILVVIRLFGGNDGLNTMVPIHDDEYYRLRRDSVSVDLSVDANAALPLGGVSHLRMHPAMGGLATLYNEGKVAVVQGVGYPNMDLSHFRGTNIWLSASDSNVFEHNGWMGRYLEQRLAEGSLEEKHPFALECGPQLGRAFAGRTKPMGFAYSEQSFIPDAIGPTDDTSVAKDLEELITRYETEGEHHLRSLSRVLASTRPNPTDYYQIGGNLAPDLQVVSRCIRGGLETPMYIIHTGQFDTHHFQPEVHHQQLDEVCTNVLAFQRELEAAQVDHRVTILIISEFGRRPNTNNSGTDHGTAAPIFLIGRNVNPGLHGITPSTSDLDADGNLHWHVDFRSIYSSILEQWFDSTPANYIPTVLSRPFPTLPLFRALPGKPTTLVERANQPLIWPNPCSGQITVTVAGNFTGIVRTTIASSDGIPIRVADVFFMDGSALLDVSSISQGSYILLLTSGSGTMVANMRVIR